MTTLQYAHNFYNFVLLSNTSMNSSSSSCLTAINAAIECNNVGCNLLATMRQDVAATAIEAFFISLRLIRRISQSLLIDSQQLHIEMELGYLRLATDAHYEIQRVQQTVPANYRHSSKRSSKYAGRVIAMSFVNSLDEVTKTLLNKISTTLLYNIGLACMSNETASSIPKAVSFFDMAYKIGTELSGIHFAFKGDPTIQRICMDSLNLAAQIHHFRCEFDKAEERLQTLRLLIASLPPSENPEEQKTRYRFWILTDLLQSPCTAAAA